MESVEPAETKRIRRLFMGNIAGLVFHEAETLDRRDAIVLAHCGVIGVDPDRDPSVASLQQCDPASRAGDMPLGPLLPCAEAEGHAVVTPVRNLLLDSRAEVRGIGITHLERVGVHPHAAGPRVLQKLRDLKPMILADTPEGWHRAAIDVVDTLDGDWLLTVAGLEQTGVPGLQGLWNEFLRAALRPPASAVEMCSTSALLPVVHDDRIEARVAEWRSDPPSPADLARSYCDALGHLPLGSHRSLGAIMSDAEEEGARDANAEGVLGWAKVARNPLARYHACEAMLATDAVSQYEIAAQWFWEIVLPTTEPAMDGHGHRTWGLVAQLARYFVQYIETRLPADQGDALAAMGWWMAGRLLAALPDAVTTQEAFRDFFSREYGAPEAGIWELVGPPVSPSVFRHLTIFGPSPWAVSLLASIKNEEQAKWLMRAPGPGTATQRARAMISAGIATAGLPLREGRPFRFDGGFGKTFEWAASTDMDEEHQEVLRALSGLRAGAESESLPQLLQGLLDKAPHIQLWVCHAVRQQVCCGGVPVGELWELVSSDVWRTSVLPNLDVQCVEALMCALIDAAAREQPKWKPHLPHLLADLAEQRTVEIEERASLFGLMLRASGRLSAGSALRRLLHGSTGPRYRPMAAAVRASLEDVLPQASGWSAGKLRACLVDCL